MKLTGNIAIVTAAMLVLLMSSCIKDSGPVLIRPQVDTLSYLDTILPIFLDKCADCHPGEASLTLDSLNSYADLIYVASLNYYPYLRVSPFDPENSMLYQKVAGNSEFGETMPLYADPLTDEEVWLIYDWIAQGALNN